MSENTGKKNTIASVCQNILMICGVITALTGAVGGVVETVKNVCDDGGGAKAAVSAPAPAPAPAEVVGEDAKPPLQDAPADAPAAPAPEETLMGMWKRLWGWMLGSGLSIITAIMLVGWLVNKKKEQKQEQEKE